MVTTIQISEKVKKRLERLKMKRSDTYEEVIVKLADTFEEKKRDDKELLKEGYLEMAEENLKITKEWEALDEGWE